jgi:putative ABC transport system permease protein
MLLLARGISRERELAVRRALGASRGRLVRDLFFEHLVLAIAGGALGVAVADAVLRGVAASLSAAEPMLAGRIPVGASLLPMALGASVAAAVVFGLVPSIRLSRPGSAVALNGVPSPQRAPREGYGARDLVVFLEVGAAAALVVLAAMALHLFAALNHVRFAVPADRLVVMRVPSRMGEHIESRVRNVRGVADVTLTSGMIGGGGRRVQVEVGGRRVLMSRLPVADRFFDVAGLALVKGRGFLARELQDRARVVVLNATAARAIAPGGNPVGMEVRLAGRSSAGVVIGVCRDAVDYGDLAGTGLPTPEMYVPYDPREIGDVTVLARDTADAHALLAPLAEAVQLPAGTRQPVPAVLADAEHDRDSRAALVAGPLLAALAFVALLLAATGIMAVVGHSVAMRTRELGVRLALGSSPRQLVGLVLGREAKLLAAALASGAGITLLLTNAMFVELARLSVAAPPVWAAFAGVCGIAAVSCVVATWRIVRLEPAVVLRRT